MREHSHTLLLFEGNLKALQRKKTLSEEYTVIALRFWLKVLAEGKCQVPSDFWWKKDNYIKDQKLFIKGANLFFSIYFIRNLRAFGIYFVQVLKIRIWGYLPSASTFNQILKVITVYFSGKVFSLGFQGILFYVWRQIFT